MATTTPNYGWPVPTNTDYVKDGASAISDLGDAIDATVFGLTFDGMTLLSTTTLSGASTTVSGINQTYAALEIWVFGMTNATGNGTITIAPNANSGLVNASGSSNTSGSGSLRVATNTLMTSADSFLRTDANNIIKIRISNYASATNYKALDYTYTYLNGTSQSVTDQFVGAIKTNTAISSLVFTASGGTWSTGTVKVWGS